MDYSHKWSNLGHQNLDQQNFDSTKILDTFPK